MPWRRKWQLTPVFYLENSMDRGAWWATVHGVAESDMTELAHTHTPLYLEHLVSCLDITCRIKIESLTHLFNIHTHTSVYIIYCSHIIYVT